MNLRCRARLQPPLLPGVVAKCVSGFSRPHWFFLSIRIGSLALVAPPPDSPASRLIVFLALVALTSGASADLLFDSSDTLHVTIEAPMRQLDRKRQLKPEFAGVLRYQDESGIEQVLAVNIATRGNSRLETCDFPPLRLIVDTGQAEGTVFAGQRKLKLVTQCDRSSYGKDWLLLELGIYRAYNVITDYSYRVRRLQVTYQDNESERLDRIHPAFIIESTGAVAERLQRKSIRPPSVDIEQYSAVESAHNLLFQYLVGNTDFSVKRGPSGEGCCHNGRVLAPPGRQDDWVALPYDFDQAGLINTDYALPSEQFSISKVTRRLYRGFCSHNDVLRDSITLFNERREDITAALILPELRKRKFKRAHAYVDKFYEVINDPDDLYDKILNKCRGPRSVPVRKTNVSPR